MKPSRLIGITGASGSGKTTVARDLAKAAGDCLLISQDNWYRNLPDGVDAKDWNFDDPAGIDLEQLAIDLAALKAGQPVEGPQYVFADHRRLPETITLTPSPIMIVEGLFLFTTEALRSVFDLKVFIDVPPDICLERRIARDVVERGRTEEIIRRRWKDQVEPMYRKYTEPTRIYADRLFIPEQPGSAAREKQIRELLKKVK